MLTAHTLFLDVIIKPVARGEIKLKQNKTADGWLFRFSRPSTVLFYFSFYRAMHFSARRGIAIACRVCLSVCLSVTLVNCDHINWNSSKIMSPLVSLGRSLFCNPT